MAFDAGSVVATIKADITDFQNGIKKAQGSTKGLKDSLGKVGGAVANVGKQAAILTGVAGAGLSFFLKDSSEQAKQFEKALITLDIVSEKFGESAEKTKQSALELGKELRIGTGSAAESLQNLLKSGLGLDDATELLRRFTNEAITGKSPSISLSQAVENLSFAYATNNSALGNLSGINENFNDIIKKGKEALEAEGVAAGDITEEMAKFRGMMDLTNLTLGSSERFTGTLIDRQAVLEQRLTELKITVGQGLNKALSEMLNLFSESGLLEATQQFIANIPWDQFVATLKQLGDWIKNNQEVVLSFFQGLGIALAALAIIGTITGLLALLANPLFLIAAAITTLFMAWQNNWFGIRDTTMLVIEALTTIWNDFLIPAIHTVKEVFNEDFFFIRDMIEGALNAIIGFFQLFWVALQTIVLVILGGLTGNWDEAMIAIKALQQDAIDALMRMFSGILTFLTGWGVSLISKLVSPFEKAWNKIKEIRDKIKNALDFTKRQSPSVVDIVNMGVSKVNKALEGLEAPINFKPPQIATSIAGSVTNPNINQVTVDMGNAIISDEFGAKRMGEMVGDSIIRKLQLNIRV